MTAIILEISAVQEELLLQRVKREICRQLSGGSNAHESSCWGRREILIASQQRSRVGKRRSQIALAQQ